MFDANILDTVTILRIDVKQVSYVTHRGVVAYPRNMKYRVQGASTIHAITGKQLCIYTVCRNLHSCTNNGILDFFSATFRVVVWGMFS